MIIRFSNKYENLSLEDEFYLRWYKAWKAVNLNLKNRYINDTLSLGNLMRDESRLAGVSKGLVIGLW